jgi:uncharacterized membrane protein
LSLKERHHNHQSRRLAEERLFAQNRQLYLLIRELRDDVREVKAELRRQRSEQSNELSSQVLDVSKSFSKSFEMRMVKHCFL